LDNRATTTPKGIDTTLEALEAINRGEIERGKTITSKNAIKTGSRLDIRRFIKKINQLLREQKKALSII